MIEDICSVENCDHKRSSRGLCNMHYLRLRRLGSTEKSPVRLCTIPGCGKKHHAGGLCKVHYRDEHNDTQWLFTDRGRTWHIWHTMKQRCYDSKHQSYPYYGGRGVKVCERWHTFDNFLEDMGYRPGNLTIDRIDNDKGYEPGNCRWITMREQNLNRRVTKK